MPGVNSTWPRPHLKWVVGNLGKRCGMLSYRICTKVNQGTDGGKLRNGRTQEERLQKMEFTEWFAIRCVSSRLRERPRVVDRE
jgi:hypothetical protein